jgi:hypothetical protein
MLCVAALHDMRTIHEEVLLFLLLLHNFERITSGTRLPAHV